MKSVALMYSKHRNAFGLVGIQAIGKKVHVNLARHWTRDQLTEIPGTIATLHNKIQWGNTITDQLVGEHLIQELKNHGLDISVITTQKDIKDPKPIRRIKKMDLIEMVQFMLVLFQEHRILFSTRPSPAMQELESQVALYSEHKTESGGINYYGPGDEMDDLVKALIVNCFSVRYALGDYEEGHVVGGIDDRRDDYVLNILRGKTDDFEDGEFSF